MKRSEQHHPCTAWRECADMEQNPIPLCSGLFPYLSLQWLLTMPVKDALLNKQQEQRIFKTVFHYQSILVSRRNYTHTHTPKLYEQNCSNMAEACPSLKKYSCTVAPKSRSQASQCPLFVFSVGSNQRYPLQPAQKFLDDCVTSEFCKYLNYSKICCFDLSSELPQIYQMTYGKKSPVSSMTAFYASHVINDVEYQNNLLQELKLSFKKITASRLL